MKTTLAVIGLSLTLVAAPAFADQPDKPRYKKNGDLCTAQEVANPPVMKVRYRSTVAEVKVECLTRAEWSLDRSAKADAKRYETRERDMMFAQQANQPADPAR